MNSTPKILIVDDEPFNVDYLEQELEDFGYETISAGDGREALSQVAVHNPDMILLDIMMPIMDGFEVLEVLRSNARWRDIPVVVISANNDMESIVRGIELGADDYLAKPFNPTLLEARLKAGLERKEQRDKEVEYLAQVNKLTHAANSIQADSFEEAELEDVAARSDALGTLAQVFQKMAQEVHAREQRLRQQIKQLELDIQDQQEGAAETAAVYIPMDRRHAIAKGEKLPATSTGTALYADISGFTPFTAAFVAELGKQRGAEELARLLKQVFTPIIDQIHRYGGSVIGFSGDAVTCWFEGDSSLPAAACSLAIQKEMGAFESISTPSGSTISIKLKIALTAGTSRRFLIGRPDIQKVEILAGGVIDRLSTLEKQALPGEILIESSMASDSITLAEWRDSAKTIGVLKALNQPVSPTPWPALEPLPDDGLKPWLLSPAFSAIKSGTSQFTPELRSANALFLQFFGLDFDHDPDVGDKFNHFICWVQEIVDRYEGFVIQVTTGEKGSFLYASFGALLGHEDDAARATMAAMDLLNPPEMPFITKIQIGVTGGEFYVGAYGSPKRRTYGALGDKANVAARLMVAADGGVLCDEALVQKAKVSIDFEKLDPITVKGKSGPLAVYRPLAVKPSNDHHSAIDQLPSIAQMTLKVASIIGPTFTLDELTGIHPHKEDKARLSESLQILQENRLIQTTETGYAFVSSLTHKTTYRLMLFAQKRQLHRALAEWYESDGSAKSIAKLTRLANHWQLAEDHTKAIGYLEKAGEQARQEGNIRIAVKFYNEALALEASSS